MRLLIIGSLDGQIAVASKIALARGAKVITVSDIEAALYALRNGRGADLAMIDVSLNIRYLVEQLARERIVMPVVACGIGSDATAAADAIRAGAKEYLPLPPEPELIAAVLEAVTIENNAFIFKDRRMLDIIKLADQIAPSAAGVLISGESGTGKEVLARYIHRKSTRAQRPFVSVNCAAIPEALLESELFGHEKGAFTGAIARRLGKFEEANGGTLLLDEISEMDVRLQAKLLRVIQEKEVDRIGGTKPVKVDIRIIATTNRDLGAEVARGTFREDLFYRLNVLGLCIPPLRERPDDIETLAVHFLKYYSHINGIPLRPFSAAASAALRSSAWPGNVRELENTIHRAVLLGGGAEVELDALRLPDLQKQTDSEIFADPSARDSLAARALVGQTVANVERTLILDTLSHCLGNRTQAATILGISIRTLRNKLRLYSDEGIPVPLPNDGQRVSL